jgi:hypothetical protein
MSDISTWVTAIATAISAWAAYAMWKVSKSLYDLQSSVESSKEPKIHFWCNSNKHFTLLNLGKEPLAIRTLRVLTGLRSPTQQNVLFKFEQMKKDDQGYITGNSNEFPKDIILNPNKLYQIMLQDEMPQLTIEAMYYDNSFEFLEIDTSILGGKYILTGKGRK